MKSSEDCHEQKKTNSYRANWETNRKGKKFRILGFIFITIFLILFINGKSKAEYISAAFIPLFASGGIFYEQMKERKLKKISL
jgi:hypothetical protein